MYKYCYSPRHGNGNGYHVKGNPPLCPECGDPWMDPQIYTPEAIADAKQHAIESKQQPKLNVYGEIILQWMYFTDDELLEIIERDKHRDVIKAALATLYLNLRSEVRQLGDYECQPYTMLSSHWVAAHISTQIKWVDFWARGIPLYWKGNERVRIK